MPHVRAPSDPHGTAPDDTNLDQALPGRIRTLRRALNMTAHALDTLTGQCAGTTGRLERGEQRIYAAHLFKIAQATGVDIGWFYPENPAKSADGSHPSTDHRAHDLLNAYLRIKDPSVRRDVFDLIANLANRS